MNKVVEMIHAAFDEAEDLLLQEAEKFEQQKAITPEEQEYLENMTRLGFDRAEGVNEIKERKGLLDKSRQLVRLVRHYKEEYPLLKFLTLPQLEEICKKYNLIYAPVSRYKGHVPKKNLKEIARVPGLKLSDSPSHQTIQRTVRGGSELSWDDMNGLFIAAPEKDFDLKGLRRKKGARGFFQTLKRFEPDDPIVFRFVEGGIQVLSKWGPEAADPELVNPLDN